MSILSEIAVPLKADHTWGGTIRIVDAEGRLIAVLEKHNQAHALQQGRFATLLATAPSMLQLLESIEEAWGEKADNDEPVSGADMVEWFFTTLMPEVRKEIRKANGEIT